MIRKTLHVFTAFMVGMTDKSAQAALLNMQKSLDYCMEENRVLREQLKERYGCKRLKLTDFQRRRLAVKGIAVGRHILANVTTLFQPDTILAWHRKLVAMKYDGSANRRPSGRPRVSQEIIDQVLRVAKMNPAWGYDRIKGVLANVGLDLGRTTIKRILDDNGIVPEPELKRRVQWKEFLQAHLHVMAATDFFAVELLSRQRVWCGAWFCLSLISPPGGLKSPVFKLTLTADGCNRWLET